MATHRPLSTGISLAICGLCLAVVTGCQEDRFADAPSATAPPASASQTAQPREPKQGGMQGEMPADHPPIGSSDQARQPGQTGQTGQAGARQGGARQAGSGQAMGGANPSRGDLPLKWKVPSSWASVEPASSMRLAQFRVPGPEGAQPATLAVFHFGSQGGGGVKANIERWVGQFKNPEGGEPDATIKKASIDGMTVHKVDVSGTFSAGRGMGSGKPKPNYRMLAAIADTPAGLFFFKMVGPQATLSKQTDSFDSFVSSFRFER
jgi:hypothetical protein